MMDDPFHELRLEAEYSKQLKKLIDEYDALVLLVPILKWYAEKAEAMKRYAEAKPPKTTSMTAVAAEMSLDGGTKASKAIAALAPHLTHEHDWIDPTNEYVTGGAVCLGCGAIRAESPEHLK